MVPSPETLTLTSGSSGTFTFTILINDDLQKRVPVDLSDINPGTPIAIKAYLNQLNGPVTYVIGMDPRPVTAGDVAKTIYSGATFVKDEIVGTIMDVKSVVVGGATYLGVSEIFGTSAATAGTIAGGIVLYIELWVYVAKNPIPENEHRDNNLIIGDER